MGLALVAGLGIVACDSNKNDQQTTTTTTTTETTVVETTTPDWVGTFVGTLPCADCPGIETTIVLNADNTYSKTSVYKERDTKIEENGAVTVDGDKITLTPSATENVGVTMYRSEQGKLIQLNPEGEEIEGPNAANYVLIKQ